MQAQTRTATLAQVVFPYQGLQRLLVNTGLAMAFAAVVALCAHVRFYLPENPVPITLQTFAVLLTGATLGSRWGLASQLIYYFAGMAGTPVFQGGNSGWDYVSSSATGGYLIGFIVAAYVVGLLAERGWDRKRALWAILIGTVLIYVPGLLWLGAKTPVPWSQVFTTGLYPFIPGDLIKLMGASLVLPSAWALVRRLRR